MKKEKVNRDKKIIKLQSKEVYQLKVKLLHTKPIVWRQILVASNISLGDLHHVLQVVMGWMSCHLMIFRFGEREFSLPELDDDWEASIEDAKKIKIGQLLKKPGDKISYEYDFGDGWEHEIKLEKIVDPETVEYHHPHCIAGENAAPPEDCGGVMGFENLKRVIADPKDEEYEEIMEWLSDDYPNYDPGEFSLNVVNEILSSKSTKSRHTGWVVN